MVKFRVLIIPLFALITTNYYASIFSEDWKWPSFGHYCEENSITKALGDQLDHTQQLNRVIAKIRILQLSKPGSCGNSDPTKKDHNRLCSIMDPVCNDMPGLISQLININQNTSHFFDENLAIKVEALASLLYQNMDYCSKGFPSDEKLSNMQQEINADMNKYINANKQKLGF